MSKSEKRALVFDWDGTLLDSSHYKRAGFIQLFQELGADAEKAGELHEKYSGIPRKELFSRIYEELFSKPLSDVHFQKLSQLYSELNLKAGETAHLFPEVRTTLESLRGKYQLFVSSSSTPEELGNMVRSQNLHALFTEVLGSRPGFSKGPEHFSYLCTKYGYTKSQYLFVGNDVQDRRLAEKAGVDWVLVERDKGQGLTMILQEKQIFD